jgi:hypothetical protein
VVEVGPVLGLQLREAIAARRFSLVLCSRGFADGAVDGVRLLLLPLLWLLGLIIHWGLFRGGSTVLVFAGDGRSLVRKIRCRNRAEAAGLSQELRTHGLAAVAVL